MDELLVPCLVDSGAVHTLLPSWVAQAGAIALTGGRSTRLGVGGGSTTATFAPVRLATGPHAWEAEVAFCDPWPYAWGLLGQTSFFRFFTVRFRAVDFEFEVDPIPE
ncbi:MAG: hypothetical protein ACRD2W_15160 [Acidimicrobiales bacterium]